MARNKRKNKPKRKVSNLMLVVICTMIILYTAADFALQYFTSVEVSPTLTTRPEGFKTAILPVQNYCIRKLTPRECWRLMGVKDEDFNKLHDISNTQLYKMAGNSIVADVLVAIFRNLFINKTEDVKKGNLFNL